MAAFINFTGLRFGRLVVLERQQHRGSDHHSRWLCRCDCGNLTSALSHHLKGGLTQSCGCLQREMNVTHGKWRSKAYQVWQNMIQRCRNPKNPAFNRYGGRGIKVLYSSFEHFFAEMGDPPPGLTIDRKNNDGHYEPGNCRWATRAEQERNKGGLSEAG
jgi:hypothetical protein